MFVLTVDQRGSRRDIDRVDAILTALATVQTVRAFERTAGDEIQEAVWAALREIPYGTTTTYGALAERLGFRTSAWGVGQAVGANPLCVL